MIQSYIGPNSKLLCRDCNQPIKFDQCVRNMQGIQIPLNDDNSWHDCHNRYSDGEMDKMMIKFLHARMLKFNLGLQTCQLQLVMVYPDGRRKVYENEASRYELDQKRPVYL